MGSHVCNEFIMMYINDLIAFIISKRYAVFSGFFCFSFIKLVGWLVGYSSLFQISTAELLYLIILKTHATF